MNKILRETASFNGRLYTLVTMLYGMFSYADPDVSQKLLSADVDFKILGESLKDTLSKSKII